MRLLWLTILASLSTCVFGLLYPSPVLRLLRLGIHETDAHCQHCRMNEIAHAAHLCTYCYWNLPGSRLQQYMSGRTGYQKPMAPAGR